MRIEIKDVDPWDAAAFVQKIIEEMEITPKQAKALTKIVQTHEMRVEIWEDSSGKHNSSPYYSRL